MLKHIARTAAIVWAMDGIAPIKAGANLARKDVPHVMIPLVILAKERWTTTFRGYRA